MIALVAFMWVGLAAGGAILAGTFGGVPWELAMGMLFLAATVPYGHAIVTPVPFGRRGLPANADPWGRPWCKCPIGRGPHAHVPGSPTGAIVTLGESYG